MRDSHRSQAERLRKLADVLTDGRLHQAAGLAKRLRVSQRTLYRDIDRLRDAGLPVEGKRGVGYRMSTPITLPPLDLTETEMEALELALSAIADAADPELRDAALSLAGKIGGAAWLYPGRPSANDGTFRHLATLRAAIRARQRVEVTLRDGTDVLNPLLLDYRARSWVLVAWSAAARVFRDVPVPDIGAMRPLPELFAERPGETLEDYRVSRDR